MAIRALIFDFDGLIIDTESAIYEAWRELYKSHGHPLSLTQWAHVVGTDFNSAFNPKTELERLTGQGFNWEIEESELTARVHQLLEHFDALPGVRARLAEARELGLPCSVASSSPLSWVEPHLDHLDLRGHFVNVTCRDHVERIKPEPDLFLDAARKLDADPSEVIVFEDSLNGLRAALAAGMKCVVVPGPTTGHLNFDGAWRKFVSLDSTSLRELASMAG